STLEENLEALSQVADIAIQSATGYAFQQLVARHGVPRDEEGKPVQPVVLAMGKLGGEELNFSSDVDLVLLYPAGGETDGRRPLANAQLFIKLGQQLVRLLDQATETGFVFRVDFRLRPFGSSGPLAVSFPALESYLLEHGRDWERYAYVKARAVVGEAEAAGLFDEVLRPFVYRRYLDFGVFDSLRQMKALIEEEVARRDLQDNIKLGTGGIREVEFIAQSLQLVRGGQDARLRQRHLLEALPELAQERLLSTETVAELAQAYRSLRTIENRIQALNDQQTHDLPVDLESQARLAWSMDTDWVDLESHLAAQRQVVEGHFNAVVFTNDAAVSTEADRDPILGAWQSQDREHLSQQLSELGYQQPQAAAALMLGLRESANHARMDELSRQRFERLLPSLATAAAQLPEPMEVLSRLSPLWTAVARRSAYLALLNENPQALQRLMELAARSEFVVNLLVESPVLLDELLDARSMQQAPSRADLEAELERTVARLPDRDTESMLNAIRQFQQTAIFRVALADFSGLPIMKVSDRLTDTAELILGLATTIARDELTARYGEPQCGAADQLRDTGFVVIGYGKLGGYELGYGSDLDLVFVHDSAGDVQVTNGAAPIDNALFFARLVQRLIHYLSIQTRFGQLYEVDTRLRPGGKSGLLVASLSSFGRYQREDAWVWEHQALLRSRPVVGDPSVMQRYADERADILVNHVVREGLEHEVANMRARMRDELSRRKSGEFDIKQDRGGLADLEFLVDYWVLSNANEFPQLVEYPDNVRQLESLAKAGIISTTAQTTLTAIYLGFRQRLHELALAGAGKVGCEEEVAGQLQQVIEVWDENLPA
ncbi:MAG: bifunctional [glutamate--ammonia ligase]-adenylyl-L-tyrosine phosphorylase/[glutamate--ammonia-ligase] adenylyltransferase, partial [Gammaproteobacteria bacterium]